MAVSSLNENNGALTAQLLAEAKLAASADSGCLTGVSLTGKHDEEEFLYNEVQQCMLEVSSSFDDPGGQRSFNFCCQSTSIANAVGDLFVTVCTLKQGERDRGGPALKLS